jgi:hypothetical protein
MMVLGVGLGKIFAIQGLVGDNHEALFIVGGRDCMALGDGQRPLQLSLGLLGQYGWQMLNEQQIDQLGDRDTPPVRLAVQFVEQINGQ